jgi:ubiquitin-conjugating enzyme E2 D/E
MSNSEEDMRTLLNNLQNDKRNPYSLDYWDEKKKDPFKWCVIFIPPEDSIYAGGYFKVKIEFPKNYPNSPPKFYFRTKIYHLNINSITGKVCCTVLNKKTIREYLDAVYLMFTDENVESPYNFSDIYKKNKNEYENNAKQWVKDYASIDNFEDIKPDGFTD